MSMLPDLNKLQRSLGWDQELANTPQERSNLRNYISLQLAAAGLMPPETIAGNESMTAFSTGMLESLREKNRLLAEHRAPVDERIEQFLNHYFADVIEDRPLRLPSQSLTLDRHGMARELSLPAGGDRFTSPLLESYRCVNGVLNNPASDRRTTAGTFHIVAGGLSVPADKRMVPRATFVRLFLAAMEPPDELMVLPYLSQTNQPSKTWVSLLLRPLVCPAVPGYCESKSLETRFFAPGSLVSNLDFVESIFGNAGDPLIAANDAGLDVHSWSGHTGCVILATHLTKLTKQSLGLPHYDNATDRERSDSMCWRDPSELYNDGAAFKVACRDASGVMVTIIADNYYGYCKKEVKTQISFAANLMGGVEEEHAGGALAFASYSLGDEFRVNSQRYNNRTFEDVARDYHDFIDIKPQGYGVDRFDPTVVYIPENAHVTLSERCIKWDQNGQEFHIPLSNKQVYIAPSGYKIRLEKHPAAPSWRLIGTVGEGILCHKPCTVSGGGKSEISKSLRDYMLYGPIFVRDVQEDFNKLDELFSRSYENRWAPHSTEKPDYTARPSRTLLDPKRSLGSVIQLLSSSPEFTTEYNQWLTTIPDHVYAMALIIKRFIRQGMEHHWRELFGVDMVNGAPGHELKLGDRPLVGTYLRVGLDGNRWRTFKVRQDFSAAAKVQFEDDITASVVVPANRLQNVGRAVMPQDSYKFVENCEYRLFQRPDDAVHRGLDKQTELDLSRPGNFISNFAPLSAVDAKGIVEDVIEFDRYSEPMEQVLSRAAEYGSGYVVSSAHPRLVDGKPTKNPRYLQDRPDLIHRRDTYIAYRGMQFYRCLAADAPVHVPVGAVLSGRRNNPPDPVAGYRSLAVYSPLHYQELPELVMDYVCSLTGKSPSTTGAGSEGALTKGPFNALVPSLDMNAMIVSMILTGMGGFSTAAGHIGPRFEIGHDVSMLVPEVWCRMGPDERDPKALIKHRMLEQVPDIVHNGVLVPASRLGYRITEKFVRTYIARVFDNPGKVFTKEILQPELQDIDSYADGVLQITEAQTRVGLRYFEDGSYELACPPLQAVLSIMAHGDYHGKTINDPEIRQMFSREALFDSEWYRRRLREKQERDIEHWRRFESRLLAHMQQRREMGRGDELGITERLAYATKMKSIAKSPAYLDSLRGTLGTDPMRPSLRDESMLNKIAASV